MGVDDISLRSDSVWGGETVWWEGETSGCRVPVRRAPTGLAALRLPAAGPSRAPSVRAT